MSDEEQEFDFEEAEKEEEEEEEFVNEEEEDKPSSRKRRKSAPRNFKNEDDDEEGEEDDEEDEDDDDVPLAKLKSPPKKKSKPEKPVKKTNQKPTKKVEKTSNTKLKIEPKNPSLSESELKTTAGVIFGSQCIKGELIQKLLCRWWYAIEWPTNVPTDPPKHYDAMDGMPGVFVCTNGDDVGKIKDFRDEKNKPSFKNFLGKDSSELKELLIKAVEVQKKALISAEVEKTQIEKDLDAILKWARKLNPEKADKEAEKVLRKAKLQ
jgi:hypothetical protein